MRDSSLFCPQIPAHFRTFPFFSVFFCLKNQTGKNGGPVIVSQTNFCQESPVDQITLTVRVLYIGFHFYLHGSIAHMGHPSDDHDHISLKGSLQKTEIVHRCCCNVHLRVPFCHKSGHFINPLHQHASEETACIIQISGPNNMHSFHPGLCYGFCTKFHKDTSLVCLFFIIISFSGT